MSLGRAVSGLVAGGLIVAGCTHQTTDIGAGLNDCNTNNNTTAQETPYTTRISSILKGLGVNENVLEEFSEMGYGDTYNVEIIIDLNGTEYIIDDCGARDAILLQKTAEGEWRTVPWGTDLSGATLKNLEIGARKEVPPIDDRLYVNGLIILPWAALDLHIVVELGSTTISVKKKIQISADRTQYTSYFVELSSRLDGGTFNIYEYIDPNLGEQDAWLQLSSDIEGIIGTSWIDGPVFNILPGDTLEMSRDTINITPVESPMPAIPLKNLGSAYNYQGGRGIAYYNKVRGNSPDVFRSSIEL